MNRFNCEWRQMDGYRSHTHPVQAGGVAVISRGWASGGPWGGPDCWKPHQPCSAWRGPTARPIGETERAGRVATGAGFAGTGQMGLVR